jgi:RimJ/RimL family protein N-acetyltransferase
VSEVQRYEYVLALSSIAPCAVEDASIRQPLPTDAEALAELMLDAYLGTIDDEGETLEDARQEVARYFAGAAMLDCSWLRLADDLPVSASLVSQWADRGCAIVSYVMTTAAWKGEGFASELLGRSLASLAEAGHGEVRAAITEGNVPSETIFARAGFRRV